MYYLNAEQRSALQNIQETRVLLNYINDIIISFVRELNLGNHNDSPVWRTSASIDDRYSDHPESLRGRWLTNRTVILEKLELAFPEFKVEEKTESKHEIMNQKLISYSVELKLVLK